MSNSRRNVDVNGHFATGAEDRRYWVEVLDRIARPVLAAAAEARLKETMPIECQPDRLDERCKYSHLEALGRTLAGIAPWLELGDAPGAEGQQRAELADLARRGIAATTDPDSPDYLNFTEGSQPLVDAAMLAHAVLRAPQELWVKSEPATQRNLISALTATRSIRPHFNNWLLFSAMIEAALCRLGQEWDPMRIDYALRQHEQWYKGDGVYGDGPEFHWDYYNSFIIHPWLLDVVSIVSEKRGDWDFLRVPMLNRARRYAEVLERLISPEGSYPPLGRSLSYRFGAFHLLGQIALMHELPGTISPAQVRCALTAVIRRSIEAPGTFSREGWLTIGFCGRQPSLGEGYISTGSTYACCLGLLPLGLPADDEFWTAPPADWTARRLCAGEDLPADQRLK